VGVNIRTATVNPLKASNSKAFRGFFADFFKVPLLFSLGFILNRAFQVDGQLENATHRGQKPWKTKRRFPQF
jgi:hypothetical protein